MQVSESVLVVEVTYKFIISLLLKSGAQRGVPSDVVKGRAVAAVIPVGVDEAL